MSDKIVVLAEFIVPPKYLEAFLEVCRGDSSSSRRTRPAACSSTC